MYSKIAFASSISPPWARAPTYTGSWKRATLPRTARRSCPRRSPASLSRRLVPRRDPQVLDIPITAPGRASPASDHHAILYKMYHQDMTSVTLSDFRSRQADLIAAAQREPVEITSRGAGRRAVVVSPEFYDRALQALEDQADIRAAAAAREETERVSHEDLVAELGL